MLLANSDLYFAVTVLFQFVENRIRKTDRDKSHEAQIRFRLCFFPSVNLNHLHIVDAVRCERSPFAACENLCDRC